MRSDFTENHTAEFEAFNLSGGQYKKLFGRNIGKICDMGRDPSLKDQIMKFKAETNVSWEYGTCPIYKQTICVNNWTPDDLGDYLPPYIPGKWNFCKLCHAKIFFGDF